MTLWWSEYQRGQREAKSLGPRGECYDQGRFREHGGEYAGGNQDRRAGDSDGKAPDDPERQVEEAGLCGEVTSLRGFDPFCFWPTPRPRADSGPVLDGVLPPG
jgi:hypothetical protein